MMFGEADVSFAEPLHLSPLPLSAKIAIELPRSQMARCWPLSKKAKPTAPLTLGDHV